MKAQRKRMVETQLKRRDISDPHVLRAMGEVPREVFVSEELAHLAYRDGPLPIEENQTISQPYIVALMIQAMEVRPQDTVLEIGTGSGYAAAVLSRVADRVYSIERHQKLADTAIQRFARLGYDNILVSVGDGTLGWAEHAPYDAAVVTAGSPDIPEALIDQLKLGGRLVIPVGRLREMQDLLRIRKTGPQEFSREHITGVRFVPLIGVAGWDER
jgi:protein-L-isoaspartate(D-aspartate) O-methyltransferase